MSIKINELTVENVKRIRAVRLEPAANGLTVIGGNNNQGKTSVIDAIAWALGGDRFRPSNPTREGSAIPPVLSLKLSNGLIVERRGKNSDLKVIDPDGRKGGQQLLNEFVAELALNLPKFMAASGKEKAQTLLQIIGVGDKLGELERAETEAYNRRRAVGQIADQKKKFAREMPYYPDAPDEPVSASELIRRQQDVLARNGQRAQWRREQDKIDDEIMRTEDAIADAERKLRELRVTLAELHDRDRAAQKTPAEMALESTAELEAGIRDAETINVKVRANLDKQKAEDDAETYITQYAVLTAELNGIQDAKSALLRGAELPLPGLFVVDGELTYNGQRWDNMSGSDQLKVATAVVRKLNPQCGFVLIDKLEQMDLATMREFGTWLEGEGLQAIATRVSTGDECSIIISDGYVQEKETPAPAWKKGVF